LAKPENTPAIMSEEEDDIDINSDSGPTGDDEVTTFEKFKKK